MNMSDTFELAARHDKVFRLGEKGARASGLFTVRWHSCMTLVDIPDVGRTILFNA
jgi:hypothetical protein